jgi:hypothetical protein
MNSSVLAFAGTGKFNFAWGGSMAMLTQTALDGDLLGMWHGALCDDYQVTRMARTLNKRVYFVHRCIVASPDAWSWPGLRDFAYRQYLLTRVYTPGLYALALLVLWTYPLAFWLVIVTQALYAVDWFLPLGIGSFLTPAIVTCVAYGLVFALDQVRHHHRKIAMRHALQPDVRARMTRVLQLDAWGTARFMQTHAWLATRALFSNRMTWRGITYRLDGPRSCQRIDPPPVSRA